MKALPETLKELRKKSGLTQMELSKKLGYTTSQFVSNWERGTAPFPPVMSRKFISATGCNSKELYEAIVGNYERKIEKYFQPSKKSKKANRE